MPERGVAGLDAGEVLDLLRDVLPDPAQPGRAVGLGALPRQHVLVILGDEALGDDHQRGPAPVVGLPHPRADLVHGDLLLRDQHRVGPGGHPREQGDPPDVAAHDLGDHAPVVGLPGGAQPVHGVGGDGHGGVET